MKEEIRQIYEKALETLFMIFEKEESCCFCHALTSAIVMIEKGISYDQVYDYENSERFSEVWARVKFGLSPEGEFCDLYSYRPENLESNYWFDSRDYETRRLILEELLKTVPS